MESEGKIGETNYNDTFHIAILLVVLGIRRVEKRICNIIMIEIYENNNKIKD